MSGKEEYKLAFLSADESSKHSTSSQMDTHNNESSMFGKNLKYETEAAHCARPCNLADLAAMNFTGLTIGSTDEPPLTSTRLEEQNSTIVQAKDQSSILEKDASSHVSDAFHSAVLAEFTQVNQSLSEVTADDRQTLTLGMATPRAHQTPHAPIVSQPPVMNANEELLLLRQEKHQWGIEKRLLWERIGMLDQEKKAIQQSLLAMVEENRELRDKLDHQQPAVGPLEDANRTVVEISNRSENADITDDDEVEPPNAAEESDVELAAESEEDESGSDGEEEGDENEEDGAEDDNMAGRRKKWEFWCTIRNKEELNKLRAQNQTITYGPMNVPTSYYRCNRFNQPEKCVYKMKAIQSEHGSFKVFKSGDHNHTVVQVKQPKPHWIALQTLRTEKEFEAFRKEQHVGICKSTFGGKKRYMQCYRHKKEKGGCKFLLLAVTENNGQINIFRSGEHNHDHDGAEENAAAGPSTARK